jgi:hypothetical protein
MMLAPPMFQNSPDFGDGFRRIRAVMQYAPGINPVKRFIRKVEVFSITHLEMLRQPRACHPFPGVLNCMFREDDAKKISPRFGKLLMIRSNPNANLQNL